MGLNYRKTAFLIEESESRNRAVVPFMIGRVIRQLAGRHQLTA